MDRTVTTGFAALALLTATAACSPMRDTHGFTATSPEQTKVEVGVDTKSTVIERLGSPTTQSSFDADAWYYITAVQERYAFYKPKTVNRDVLVVRFGEDDKVASVDRFGMERGRVVSYNGEKTPTRGRELGLIEQIFGNIGSSSPIRAGDDEQGRDRR